MELSKGKIVVDLKITEDCCNPKNYLHGGLSATLVDSISTLALRSYFEADNLSVPNSVSVELAMSYLSAVPEGNSIRIESEALKIGKKMAFLQANIYEKETNKLAVMGKHTKFLF